MSSETEFGDHLARAQEQRRLGHRAEALSEFIWVWDHTHQVDPKWGALRFGLLRSALSELLPDDAVAQSRFEGLRVAAEASLNDPRELGQWVNLNLILGHPERVVAWLDTITPAVATKLQVGNDIAIRELVTASGAWSVFGRLLEHPVQILTEQQEIYEWARKTLLDRVPSERRAVDDAAFVQDLRVHAGILCRSLVAAGRDAEALEVAAEARRLDPSSEMMLALDHALGDL